MWLLPPLRNSLPPPSHPLSRDTTHQVHALLCEESGASQHVLSAPGSVSLLPASNCLLLASNGLLLASVGLLLSAPRTPDQKQQTLVMLAKQNKTREILQQCGLPISRVPQRLFAYKTCRPARRVHMTLRKTRMPRATRVVGYASEQQNRQEESKWGSAACAY